MESNNSLIIFHGSPVIVQEPLFGQGKTYNDFGQGFYCTESLDLAKEWACTPYADGYANQYAISLADMNAADLTSKEFTILHWLALLMQHRKPRISTPVAELAVRYLTEHFFPDFSEYDIIKGYRADDSYFSFVRDFVGNAISLEQLSRAMRLGKLGEQFVLKSKKAFESIRFLGYDAAEAAVYYPKRLKRDESARAGYLREAERADISGLFMRDILREEIRDGDTRIR